MKLCINCKFSEGPKDTGVSIRVTNRKVFKITLGDYYCIYPSINDIYSPVTGEIYLIKRIQCNEARSYERFCGYEGKWFEDK